MLQKTLLLLLTILPSYVFSQNLTNATQINITKSWSQEMDGWTYPMNILVPTGSIPTGGYPIAILLHGNGGNGIGSINQWKDLLTTHILVAPTGYGASPSWNIADEASDAPDVEMIGELVDQLQTYSNVNPTKIRLIGSSNGSGLCNRVFIENDNQGIDIICGIVSQLNVPQYHNDDFYYPSGATGDPAAFDGYDTPKTPITGRRYLSICNDNDPIIPYIGGTSVVGVDFLDAQEAAFIVAKSQGYTGMQLPAAGTQLGNSSVYEYSYLSDQVVHLKGDARHSASLEQREYVVSYFNADLVSDNCENNITQTGTINKGTFQANDQITSTATIAMNASVTYRANVIVLENGFATSDGATFHAIIDPCTVTPLQNEEVLKTSNSTDQEVLYEQEKILLTDNKTNEDNNNIRIYPNPARALLNIEGDFKQPANYEVRSILGKRVLVGQLNTNNEQISLAYLPPNPYFLTVEGKTFKFFKVN